MCNIHILRTNNSIIQDLKAYVFTYWFGFPAVSSIKISYSTPGKVTKDVCSLLEKSKEVWKSGFFILDKEEVKSLKEGGTGMFGYLDPSTIVDTPGWVLRNYVAYIVKKK